MKKSLLVLALLVFSQLLLIAQRPGGGGGLEGLLNGLFNRGGEKKDN